MPETEGGTAGRCETIVTTADGESFVSFTDQPGVREVLARYVHAQATDMLRFSFHLVYGASPDNSFDGVRESPRWLKDTGDCEGDAATHALEVALQREVEYRVGLALAQAERRTETEQTPLLERSIRSVTDTLRRHTRKVRAIDRSGTRKALQGAGLLMADVEMEVLGPAGARE